MNTPSETATAGANSIPVTNDTSRSTKKSTWWKRGEHLVQHTPTGTFYCRVKLHGKTIRAALGTDVLTTARDRLPLKLAELRKPKTQIGTFGHYLEQFKTKTNNDTSLSPEGKKYRLRCADRLEKSWPSLLTMQADKITEDDVETWWNEFSESYNPQFVNHTLVYFRFIIKKLAKLTIDPSVEVSPVGVKLKKLVLPSMEIFQSIIKSVRANGSPEAQDSADMIEFLAYSGCRISEARGIHWQDVDWENGQIQVPCAKRRRSSREDDFRLLPMIPPMKTLLERVKARRNPQPQDRVNVLDGCRRSLTNACKRIGFPALTHHSLRHFFASVCIESGVDIQTVSRWLGHSDGGVLAQRIYGHLRREHSTAMAQKVTFGTAVLLPEIVELKQLPELATANAN
jgi:integrase